MRKSTLTQPGHAALIGALSALPFFLMNFIVALRLEPFYSFLGAYPAVRSTPVFPLLLLTLLPAGAFVALLPTIRPSGSQKRKLYLANTVVAFLLLVVFITLFAALGEELYRCQVLNIPYCD